MKSPGAFNILDYLSEREELLPYLVSRGTEHNSTPPFVSSHFSQNCYRIPCLSIPTLQSTIVNDYLSSGRASMWRVIFARHRTTVTRTQEHTATTARALRPDAISRQRRRWPVFRVPRNIFGFINYSNKGRVVDGRIRFSAYTQPTVPIHGEG